MLNLLVLAAQSLAASAPERAVEATSSRRPRDGGTRTCAVAGCRGTTRERKPYCLEHVEQHPYVRDLVAELARQEDEVMRVRRRGWAQVDVAGVTAQEVLRTCRVHGPRSVPRLARELILAPRVVSAYVEALRRAGAVTTSRGSRGATIVRIASQAGAATQAAPAGAAEATSDRAERRQQSAA